MGPKHCMQSRSVLPFWLPVMLALPLLAVGQVVRCEPCDPRALEQCRPLPAECTELVREPGCGCCLTCALQEGQTCGMYSERCGAGLSCQAPPYEPRPLKTLLEGRGQCVNSSKSKSQLLLTGGMNLTAGNVSDSDEERHGSSTEKQTLPGVPRVSNHKPHHRIDIIKKEQTKQSQRFKETYGPQSTDTLNFSSESKQETEYGPCRREMESILNQLKIMNVLSPSGVHIPNCDKKGFYKKKQCRPSHGRKRGNCWCVDKYGQPLPGYDGKMKGDVHCYNLENK